MHISEQYKQYISVCLVEADDLQDMSLKYLGTFSLHVGIA